MADAAQPGYVPLSPQYVMVPVSRRNLLGVFGLLIALVGLFIPTGIVAFLGLVLSLVAIGRPPRLAATFGVIVGLFGTFIWLIIDLLVILGIAVATVGGAGVVAAGFALTQTQVVEVTADMINIAGAVAHENERAETDEMRQPALGELDIAAHHRIDPWGAAYQLMYVDDDRGIEITSRGPDGEFGTEDDIRLSELDRMLEAAFDRFGEDMERFGQRWEALERAGRIRDGCGVTIGAWACSDGATATCDVKVEPSDDRPRSTAEAYEREAIETLQGAGDDEESAAVDLPTSPVPPTPGGNDAD